MRQFPFRILLIALLVAMAFVSPVVADLWYEHYEQGEQALKAQSWEEAARQLNSAIEKRGEPGERVRTYGMNFVSYHPYFKLGMAYYNMGRFDAALQAFDTEEGFGAIAQSADLQNLQAFRRLSEEGMQSADTARQEQIAEAIDRSLQEAEVLQQQGRLDEAMASVAKGLALDSGNTRALKVMDELRSLVAEGERQRDIDNRVATLLGEGRELLASSNYQDAAAKFNQALSLEPAEAEVQVVRGLLDEAQSKLREAIQLGEGEARTDLVSTALGEASRLEAAGQVAEALQSLQTALAVDPANAEVLAMQNRLAKVQAETDLLESRTRKITRLLGEGVAFLQGGDPIRSIAAFNRVVALDPGNTSVRNYLGQAYSAMNAAILGSGVAPILTKLPPAIVLANVADDTLEVVAGEVPLTGEMVSSAEFPLSGVILDDQPQVKVRFMTASLSDGGSDGLSEPPEITLAGTKEGNFYQFRFRQDYLLDPGAAALKVLVTDLDGLTAEQVHNVFYAPLIWNRWWFYPAIAGLLAAVVLGAQGARVRRRNRLLKRRFNPYVAGAPVTQDDLFVGREPLLSRILQTIHNNSILLYGERRIGKTTLQHHLKKRLQQMQDPEYEFFPVYVDLQGTPQEQFFATLADDVFNDLSSLLNGGALRRARPEGRAYDYTQFIREIRKVIGILKSRSSKKIKLVLLIDEVDELNNYDPRVNQRLRSLFMKSFAEDLVAVVSGVAINKHWASEGSPWYNFFEELEVKPFTRKDAEDLIQKPIRGIFKLEEGVIDLILANTECKPYLIQKICVALVNRLHDDKRREITIADVEAIGRAAEA